ncbi:GNAT family N-acetyltransferase [Microbacterium rhizomatis]|uniref:GNAT family N-acetyltransferase n=1 Tax=Microbacterium rhizomatis TaxID=1631477 RepID=A0A5J5J3Y3_9MICO|nr:GNAT family N-acetyltransferase [Microbacterium rhizomatis]KAA9110786.1 GNAT family N-acetyltransferase [Microbacterium rhizomatis]
MREHDATREVEIVPVQIPRDPHGNDAADFRSVIRLGNLMCRHDAGHDHLDQEPQQELPTWLDQTDTTRMAYLARRHGVDIGAVTLTIPNEVGTTTAEFDLCVHPDHWNEGAEQALLHRVEQIAKDRSRDIIQTWTLHRPGAGGPRLTPPTGFGSIPAHDRQTLFMIEEGFTFEQTERNSTFDLRGPFDLVERLHREALDAAGGDYRLVMWTAPTPAEHAEGFAYAISRMATDVPSGGMVFDEETWDAARVERRDARLLAGGHTVSVACVQHTPSGRIVAFNELVIGADHTRSTHQYGTLVLKEHRGHRLGTIVKTANLLRWRELVPESPRVSTFNAEENRPMLDINEAIGFTAASYAAAWKKVLA